CLTGGSLPSKTPAFHAARFRRNTPSALAKAGSDARTVPGSTRVSKRRSVFSSFGGGLPPSRERDGIRPTVSMNDQLNIGTRIYRLFLLSLIFGVLWVKGYLWWVFSIALLLYLSDTFLFPMISAASEYSRPSSGPQRMPSWAAEQRSAGPPARPPADAENPSGGDDDFREPKPSRSAPRRRGS